MSEEIKQDWEQPDLFPETIQNISEEITTREMPKEIERKFLISRSMKP